MLEIVAKGFEQAKAALTGQTTLTEAHVDAAMREVRMALLEGDVHLDVVRAFLAKVRERAIGEVVTLRVKDKRASPSDHFTRICYEALVDLMGPSVTQPIAFAKPVTTIMMVGLQGVGKTTTCAKLAKYLLLQKRRPLLVGADLQRPAAQAQLRTLGERIGVPVYAPPGKDPVVLCQGAQAAAEAHNCDVIILDTAGRLSIDEVLMNELVAVNAASKPQEVLLVVDAMAGQDSLQTAKGFASRLDISGFIMTKLDGDARGGAALSIKHMLNKPIKFLGMGEAVNKLELFRAEGLASRILGMGDIVGLMQDFTQVVDEKKAEADARKMLQGQFTLDDFLGQLKMLEKMGSVRDLMGKLPMMGGLKGADMSKIDNKTFVVMRSMIQSMTKEERSTPKMIDVSRQKRIARGCGRKVEEVKGLLDRFGMMQGMMQNLRKQPGLMSMLGGKGGGGMQMPPGLGGGGGGMPSGFPGMPGMPGFGPGMGQMQPAGSSAPKNKQKAKDKRKAEKQARKKTRR